MQRRIALRRRAQRPTGADCHGLDEPQPQKVVRVLTRRFPAFRQV
jgi:hypothetical protein